MAPVPKPTEGWEKVGDRFYRKIQLYSAVFDPDVELENYLISGAPYSGALGMLRPLCGVNAVVLTWLSTVPGSQQDLRLSQHRGTTGINRRL